MTDLGNQLLRRNPGLSEVNGRLAKLVVEHEAILRGWNEKGEFRVELLE